MMKRRTIELRELARLGGGAAVVRRRGGGATVVAERRLEVAAEAVRGGEAARGEDEERRHLFRGSKFILGLDGQKFGLTGFFLMIFNLISFCYIILGFVRMNAALAISAI